VKDYMFESILDEVTGGGKVSTLKNHNYTDSTNAERFAKIYGDRIRYDHLKRQWLVWKGHRWTPDEKGLVYPLAIEMARKMYLEAGDIEDREQRIKAAKWAITSESKKKIEEFLGIAKNLSPIADDGKNWDENTMLLSCENGIIDLTTGILRDGKPEDRITMTTGMDFDPEAKCPIWEKFINEVFLGNEELIHFIHKSLGYSITGETVEQKTFYCHGVGANGKSVLFTAIGDVLGDYKYSASENLFQKNRTSTATNDVAETLKKRFVVSSETMTNTTINEVRLKKMTGGDTQTARLLFRDNISFKPTAKPWFFFNHKPKTDDNSNGLWRRIMYIPFEMVLSEEQQDKKLPDKLRSEYQGILTWLVKGCLMWQKEGLNPIPEKVQAATKQYKDESDDLRDFINERCFIDESVATKVSVMYKNYKAWATSPEVGLEKDEYLNRVKFPTKMEEKFKKITKKDASYWSGVGLNNKEGLLVGGTTLPNLALGGTSKTLCSNLPPRECDMEKVTANDISCTTQAQNLKSYTTDTSNKIRLSDEEFNATLNSILNAQE